MVTATIPPEMLERIKKCLALSRNNSFEAEADTAMRMAEKLMGEYGLSMQDVDMDQTTGRLKEERIVNHVSNERWWMSAWEKELAPVPKFLLPVSFLFHFDPSRHAHLMFIGTPGDCALAVEVFKILRSEIQKLSRTELKENRNSYMLGCAHTLKHRAFAMAEDRKRTVQNPGNGNGSVDPGMALMVVKSNQIAERFKAIPQHTTIRQGGRVSSGDAYKRGALAGEKINLNFHKALR